MINTFVFDKVERELSYGESFWLIWHFARERYLFSRVFFSGPLHIEKEEAKREKRKKNPLFQEKTLKTSSKKNPVSMHRIAPRDNINKNS